MTSIIKINELYPSEQLTICMQLAYFVMISAIFVLFALPAWFVPAALLANAVLLSLSRFYILSEVANKWSVWNSRKFPSKWERISVILSTLSIIFFPGLISTAFVIPTIFLASLNLASDWKGSVFWRIHNDSYKYRRKPLSWVFEADRDFMLAAVSRNGSALQYASKALKADREVVLKAVAQDGRALQYASNELKAARDFMLAAVSTNGNALQYASKALKADREVVLAAVRTNGNALQYASESLRGEQNVVLTAVAQHGNALVYASESLRGDRDVVRAAVRQDWQALRFASKALKGNSGVVCVAVAQNRNALEYASNELKADRDFMLKAVAKFGNALEYASEALRGDREVVLAAVRQDGYALRYANDTLRADPVVVGTAVAQNKYALECATKAYQDEWHQRIHLARKLNLPDDATQEQIVEAYNNYKDYDTIAALLQEPSRFGLLSLER